MNSAGAMETGQWDAALLEIQAATDLQPTRPDALLSRCRAHRLKQVTEAIKEYEKALELDPDHFRPT